MGSRRFKKNAAAADSGARKVFRQADPLRLLFVEDDEDFQVTILHLLGRLASERPVESLFLSNVHDAHELVAAIPWDAIVSDYNLPDGTGVEVLQHAKSALPESTRIVLTGNPDDVRAHERSRHAFHRVWDKRAPPRELQAHLQRLVADVSGLGMAG